MTNLYLEAHKRQKELLKLESTLKARLAKYPQGRMRMITKGNFVMYYLRRSPSDSTWTYISVHDEKKIRTFLQKSYDEKALKLVQGVLADLAVLLSSEDKSEQIQNLYTTFPKRARKFLKPADLPDDEYARLWLAKPYQTKELPAGLSVFTSMKGDHVRSKSELNIANALYSLHIPYKYECPLILSGDIVIYPDFTVLNVKQRKIFYWEHRGMMDDREYSIPAVWRVKEYEKNGIFLGGSLIITEETLRQPLGTDEIKNVIHHYLLS
ncbi:MAG: hypothetical protein LKG56_10265 [Lachnospiraceae bacterium]|jgi:hypothetical protein|nr:hypothetical protein [Lachnospiraceae bacterium]MCH4029871.1 hypothetical protein [Lachnospiraceae bacterium]MCH4071341.1 hypothetical protein [Lachnospiraceae bacterium]MCH4109388.1 hypothetical protein [Lachnospiraceae bacterium]MCI1303116.1 hypothetical protein [Lachnospiraceae bacterium]